MTASVHTNEITKALPELDEDSSCRLLGPMGSPLAIGECPMALIPSLDLSRGVPIEGVGDVVPGVLHHV